MAKLIIEYRTKDEEHYSKGKTYFIFSLKDKTTIISIAPDETRKLNEIVNGIEKELQDGYHLNKDEKFEIEEYDKYIMEYEKDNNYRMKKKLYPYFRYIAKNADNTEKIDEFLKQIRESRCY